MTTIRQERPVDAPAREALLDLAYGASRHGKPSARLRAGRLPAEELALVAVEQGKIVGTVRLWHIHAGRGRPALLLGPLAVDPIRRRQGIGSSLMRHALAEAKRHGHAAVILVGDASYYARFGFSATGAGRLSISDAVDPARLLALELVPHALDGAQGRIVAAGNRAGILDALSLPKKSRTRLIPRAA